MALINEIRGEALVLTCEFLKRRGIEYGNILEFIRHPDVYPGDSDGPKKIFESKLNKLFYKYRTAIQANDLALNFVYNTIIKQITNKKRKIYGKKS